VIDANGVVLAHVYGQPPAAIAFSDQRLTDHEAEKISWLIVRLPELIELERDRNKAKSRRRSPPLQRPVTLGDSARDEPPAACASELGSLAELGITRDQSSD
jgi:hypothetical protein